MSSCHISLFYIKPQLAAIVDFRKGVVIYRYSTSNHNCHNQCMLSPELSYIVILHQTTTSSLCPNSQSSCHISLFYIKPQPPQSHEKHQDGCHISLFYIKPQLSSSCLRSSPVVIYRYSTSNHNVSYAANGQMVLSYIVILHQTTT